MTEKSAAFNVQAVTQAPAAVAMPPLVKVPGEKAAVAKAVVVVAAALALASASAKAAAGPGAAKPEAVAGSRTPARFPAAGC